MNSKTVRTTIDGPAGALECAVDLPDGGVAQGTAVICHPHPQFGGTLDNKVVQTLARAVLQRGLRSVRFNFRGIGASAGAWDEGRGEVDDALAVIAAHRPAAADAANGGARFLLCGFSFGGWVAAMAATRLSGAERPERLVLVAPSTQKHAMPPVPADTLVLHGEADDVVPLAATLDWARPLSLPVVVFPGVGHFFHGQLTPLRDIVVRQLG